MDQRKYGPALDIWMHQVLENFALSNQKVMRQHLKQDKKNDEYTARISLFPQSYVTCMLHVSLVRVLYRALIPVC